MGEGLRKETLRLRRISRVFNSNMHVIHVMLLNIYYFSKSTVHHRLTLCLFTT
jgi:hypothetical protein